MDQPRKITATLLQHELEFTTSRSSGPGGQNVNKVNTKVILRFDVNASQILTEEEKTLIRHKLANKLSTEGVLILSAQEKRTQLQNKEVVLEKFDHLLEEAFKKRKKRKATKPSKTSVQKRLQEKKKRGEKKKWRQGGDS